MRKFLVFVFTATHLACGSILTVGKFGAYTWDPNYWRVPNSDYMQYLASPVGRATHGDVYISVADWSSPSIAHPKRLRDFILEYRAASGRYDTIVYFIYGDVTEKNNNAMMQFTRAFFDWFSALPEATASKMGMVGISYDVEMMKPEHTREILQYGQLRKASIHKGTERLRIQHTIDDDENVRGTEAIMQLADSGLAMIYSNFVTSDKFKASKSIVELGRWFLDTQCPKCKRFPHVRDVYKAKLSIMVETTCSERFVHNPRCARKSFCAFDRPGEGMTHIRKTLGALAEFFETALPNPEHIVELFDIDRLFVLHDWTWTRCLEKYPNSQFHYENCDHYHDLADICRDHPIR